MVNGWKAAGYFWLITLLSGATNKGVGLIVERLKQSEGGYPSAAFLSYLNQLTSSLIAGVLLCAFGYYMYQLALKNESG